MLFKLLFTEYIKAWESFSNFIALILGYYEFIGTFVMGLEVPTWNSSLESLGLS